MEEAYTSSRRTEVPFETFLQGFSKACGRYLAASDSFAHEKSFMPLFEALNWAVALDDRIGDAWEKKKDKLPGYWAEWYANGPTAKGVRFVRNRVHHQWANAVFHSHSGNAAAAAAGFMWRWLPADQLPPGRDDTFRDEYEQHVAADLVSTTLQLLTGSFHEAAEDLGLLPDGSSRA